MSEQSAGYERDAVAVVRDALHHSWHGMGCVLCDEQAQTVVQALADAGLLPYPTHIDRCQSTFVGLPCALPAGHEGAHRNSDPAHIDS